MLTGNWEHTSLFPTLWKFVSRSSFKPECVFRCFSLVFFSSNQCGRAVKKNTKCWKKHNIWTSYPRPWQSETGTHAPTVDLLVALYILTPVGKNWLLSYTSEHGRDSFLFNVCVWNQLSCLRFRVELFAKKKKKKKNQCGGGPMGSIHQKFARKKVGDTEKRAKHWVHSACSEIIV